MTTFSVLASMRAAAPLLLCLAAGLQAAEQKPNVVMIIVDDLAPVVSPYGGPVSTPALDKLAKQGVRFTNNFANVPVCGASRASMLSGLAPSSSRFLSYDSRLDQDVENAVSLPAFFRQNGWHTLANGKVFDVIADSAESWSEPVWSPPDSWFGKEPDGRGEHLQAAYIEEPGAGRTPYFERLDVQDIDYPDGRVALKSVEDLHRLAKSDAPFFLAVGFRKPHLPFTAPERYWQPSALPELMLPATWYEPTATIPKEALHRSPELLRQYDALPLLGSLSDARAGEIVNAYYAAVRYADAQVGLVLEGLAASEAADNTLVVVLGDHGFLLGEQRMWTKHALLEPALNTPLIISYPGGSGGQEAHAVTDLLDVFPTLVDLAGLERPTFLEGVSLRPLLANPGLPRRPDKSGSIARWMNGESIRQLNYRYTRWFDDAGETISEALFDLETDPLEQTNLAHSSEFAVVVTRLSDSLREQRTGPVWSDALERQYTLWQLASSNTGQFLVIALAYPIPVAIGALFLLAGVVGLIIRAFRRNRADRQPA